MNLNINWLIFHDKCLKENKTNSLIKSSNKSSNNLAGLVKCINKVDSIITGKDSHNVILKKNAVMKNIFNEILPNTERNRQNVGLKNMSFILNDTPQFNKTPIFIAHYVYKDITNYVEKKLITYEGNFNSIFSKWNFTDPDNLEIRKEKQALIKYHTEHKNDLIDYIYSLRNKDETNIKKLENKHKLFEMNKKSYLNYYSIYGINCTNNFDKYAFIDNDLLINFLYN